MRPVMIPARLRRLVEFLLPWYNSAEEARHNERTEYIRQRSIAVRMDAEARLQGSARIRRAYREYGKELHR
jgi:hypothetical protein